jgi:hypothetical protein
MPGALAIDLERRDVELDCAMRPGNVARLVDPRVDALGVGSSGSNPLPTRRRSRGSLPRIARSAASAFSGRCARRFPAPRPGRTCLRIVGVGDGRRTHLEVALRLRKVFAHRRLLALRELDGELREQNIK